MTNLKKLIGALMFLLFLNFIGATAFAQEPDILSPGMNDEDQSLSDEGDDFDSNDENGGEDANVQVYGDDEVNVDNNENGERRENEGERRGGGEREGFGGRGGRR